MKMKTFVTYNMIAIISMAITSASMLHAGRLEWVATSMLPAVFYLYMRWLLMKEVDSIEDGIACMLKSIGVMCLIIAVSFGILCIKEGSWQAVMELPVDTDMKWYTILAGIAVIVIAGWQSSQDEKREEKEA